MTTPELPPLRRYDLCLRGYENTMKRADDGDYCDNDDREARERILLDRIAELEADAERRRMELRKVDTSRVRWASNRFKQPDEADVRNALRSCADAIDAARKA